MVPSAFLDLGALATARLSVPDLVGGAAADEGAVALAGLTVEGALRTDGNLTAKALTLLVAPVLVGRAALESRASALALVRVPGQPIRARGAIRTLAFRGALVEHLGGATANLVGLAPALSRVPVAIYAAVARRATNTTNSGLVRVTATGVLVDGLATKAVRLGPAAALAGPVVKLLVPRAARPRPAEQPELRDGRSTLNSRHGDWLLGLDEVFVTVFIVRALREHRDCH